MSEVCRLVPTSAPPGLQPRVPRARQCCFAGELGGSQSHTSFVELPRVDHVVPTHVGCTKHDDFECPSMPASAFVFLSSPSPPPHLLLLKLLSSPGALPASFTFSAFIEGHALSCYLLPIPVSHLLPSGAAHLRLLGEISCFYLLFLPPFELLLSFPTTVSLAAPPPSLFPNQ